MPTLPLASFEADSVRMPEAPDSLPTRALHAIADAIPQNKELPPPQFPMDPRSLSLARMLEEAARHSGNWADWQSKTRPEDYSPGDVLAPLGGAGVGAVAARHAIPSPERIAGNWPEAISKHYRQERKEGNPMMSPLSLGLGAAFQGGGLSMGLHDLAHGNLASGIPLTAINAGSAIISAWPHIEATARIKRHLDQVAERESAAKPPEGNAGSVLYTNNRDASLLGIGTIVNGLDDDPYHR